MILAHLTTQNSVLIWKSLTIGLIHIPALEVGFFVQSSPLSLNWYFSLKLRYVITHLTFSILQIKYWRPYFQTLNEKWKYNNLFRSQFTYLLLSPLYEQNIKLMLQWRSSYFAYVLEGLIHIAKGQTYPLTRGINCGSGGKEDVGWGNEKK